MFIPWQFNTAYSSEAEGLVQDSPVLKTCLDALAILNDPRKTGIIDKGKKSNMGNSKEAFLRGEGDEATRSRPSHVELDAAEWVPPHCGLRRERITIILALCNYMCTLEPSVNRIESMKAECEKLRTIAAQGTFKEGDFMRSVHVLCGDQGTATCRAMLDGISGAGIRREAKARVFEDAALYAK